MHQTTMAILHLAVLVPLVACAGTASPWRKVDPHRPMISIEGKLEVLEMAEVGDVRLEVVPVAGDWYSLAPGQERLICILHESDRHYVFPILAQLRVGQTIGVGGYWMAREESAGTRHYLNDTTDVRLIY